MCKLKLNIYTSKYINQSTPDSDLIYEVSLNFKYNAFELMFQNYGFCHCQFKFHI